MVEFGILGPLQVRGRDDRELEISGTRRRGLLLRLLVDANTLVSSDRLIEDLWEGDPPTAASQTIQSHISNLRRALGKDRIATQSKAGYRLVITETDNLDATAFEREVERAHGLLGSQPETAAHMLESALTRWRGRALADGGDAEWARAPRARWERLRLSAGDDLLTAWLDLGEHDRVVVEAEHLIADNPLHERLWCHLMLALYQAGRQADSLRTFARLRARLGDEIGIDPGPEAVALEQAILEQRPELLAIRHPLGESRAPTAVALPTGISTFLLTDIVGSTRIWELEPEAMGNALAHHDLIIRDAVSAQGGVLLKARGEGDSTFSVFTRAGDAAAALLYARRALHDTEWPTSEPLLVRMVLHTGEALERDGDYYGRTVNRAARLRSIAEGDRPLVSAATAQLLADQLPSGSHLVELGMRELRDLDRPELVYRLVDDEVPTTIPDRATASLPPAFELPAPPRLRTAPVFVGRDAPRRRIRDLAARAERGERQIALIAGEPGIGKTALAAQVALQLHAEGWLVLYGRCDSRLSVPYQPFVEALDFVVREEPAELVGIAGTSELAQVEPLLPSVRDRIPGLPVRAETDAETDRFFVMHAAMRLLARLGDTRPVALVLDDLHWADAATLAMLRELASTESMRVLAIGTFRDSEPEPALTETLAVLRCHPNVERLALHGLDESELAALVAAAAGHELGIDESTHDLLVGLRAETNGNPFFALEILRYLASTGDLLQNAAGRWEAREGFDFAELPESIREVVSERVGRVGPEVAAALTAAAGIGMEFDLAVLARVVGRDEDDLLDVLALAEPAGLVTSIGTDRFGFAHALIANSLLRDLSASRRGSLHRKIAEAYEQLGWVDTHLGELAQHWQAARGADAAMKACTYALRAGDLALAALAPGDALRWYHTALDGLGDADPTLRVTLRVSIGDALRQAGDETHREVLLAAGREAQELGLGHEVVRAALANYRGWASNAGTVDTERIALLEAALDAVDDDRCSTRAELLSVLAAELAFTDDYERRRELSDRALEIARELDDPPVLSRVLSSRGNTLRVPETAAERDAHSAENMALTEGLGDAVARWAAVSDRLTVAIEIGDVVEVDRTLAEEIELATELRQPYHQWIALVHQSWRALVAGHLDESESFNTQALELGTGTGQPDAFVFYASQMFLLRAAQGRLDELVPAMELSTAENPTIAGFRAALAYSYAESHRPEDAARLLAAEAATNFASVTYDVVWGTTMCLFGEVAATLGAADEAAVILDRLSAHTHLIAADGAHVFQPIALTAGRLAGSLGRAGADGYLDQAEQIARRLDAPIWLALTLVARSELHHDRAPAVEALRLVERLGDTSARRRAQRFLDSSPTVTDA